MIHLPDLIFDLGLILGSAGLITLLFKKLKQPVVLGYIIAGILVGPYFSLFPTVSDLKGVAIWAEIGVIFLLFSLGLEFSFKKLARVGGTASITALVEVVFMMTAGYITGQLLGWTVMDSIFLGGILSVSSTTIIIRAFEELGAKSQKFAGVVFGVLIVEDLVAILLLVLLSTLAVSREFEGVEMLFSLGKLVFFLVLWFLGGIFILPTFLRKVKKYLNEETTVVISIGLCFMMVILATKVGFSPALGAFIMGSILAETTEAEKIEHLVLSVKDLFAAVFFVSVGMLIDPRIMLDYAGPILLITVITVGGKLISTSLGALISGQPLKTSVQAGMSLSQIGEFSFIIATLGVTLKVTSDFLYPIAVAVSAITTFTTPYLIKYSEPAYKKLESILPESWTIRLNRYNVSTQVLTSGGDWKKVVRYYLTRMLVNSVIIISIIFLSSKYIAPWINNNIENGFWGALFSSIVTLILISPFLWALGIKRIQKKINPSVWLSTTGRGPLIVMEFLRIVLAIFFVGMLVSNFFSAWVAFFIALPSTILILFIFSKRLQTFYSRLEKRFLSNLNERQHSGGVKAMLEITPWDAHLTEFVVSADSMLVGKTLLDLGLRETHGVNIALIERGSKVIPIPGRDERLFPGDVISVIGTDEQLSKFRDVLEISDPEKEFLEDSKDISLKSILITKRSPLLDKTIRDSGIREKKEGLVVGIERGGHRILNPDSFEVLALNDIVWIVGNTDKLKSLSDRA